MPNPLAAAKGGTPEAAAATVTTTVTLATFLRGLRWEEAMRLAMESDPYYHYTPIDDPVSAPPQRPSNSALSPTASTPAEATASPPRFSWAGMLATVRQRLRRYLLCSSKTRLLVHAGAVGYCAYVVTHPSRHVPCIVTIDGASSSGSGSGSGSGGLPAVPASSTTCYLYESAEGMQLLMRDEMPRWVVFFHAVAGVLLLPLAIAQKESVWYMPFHGPTVPPSQGASAQRPGETPAPADPRPHNHLQQQQQQSRSEEKRAWLRNARAARWWHGTLGFATLACVGCMVGGGVLLRSYSVFSAAVASQRAGVPNFASAMFVFAAPWLVLAPATGVTGQRGACAAHALLGGLVVKAVLAVPFERMLGCVCQRVAGVTVALPPRRWSNRRGAYRDVCVPVTQHVEAELEAVYFRSVAATTVIFGVWGLVDVYRFVRLARTCVNASTTTPTSTATAAVAAGAAPSLSVGSQPARPPRAQESHGVVMP